MNCKSTSTVSHRRVDRNGSLLVVLDVFIKALKLPDLEGQDADERDHHQEERVDSPLH